MAFKDIGIRPAELMLPREDIAPETWACVACDQFTSEPEYWREAEKLTENLPSTLKLMLPECYLKDSEGRIPRIHEAMRQYIDKGILQTAVKNGFVLCERTTPSGTRLGLVVTVDLECYDYAPGSKPLIRPTEQTVASRLPARLAIRRGAPLEMSHILILIDDPNCTVLEPLRDKKDKLRPLYDFELMLGGGHLTGWAVEDEEDLKKIDEALNTLRLSLGEDPLLLAVGDGNHSLATARAAWNEIKEGLSEEEKENHPARYAMCEIENIHDEALLFEPIHRLITGAEPEELMEAWKEYAEKRNMELNEGGDGHCFRMICAEGERKAVIANPEGSIPCETIQLFLDQYLKDHPEAGIDYIHGEDSLRTLAGEKHRVGFLLPDIDKHGFFDDVRRLGTLPRKTFSMGEAREKRYYMECRKLFDACS